MIESPVASPPLTYGGTGRDNGCQVRADCVFDRRAELFVCKGDFPTQQDVWSTLVEK